MRTIGGKRKTNEEYIAEVASKNPNIEVVDEYINATTKIKHRCLVDKYEWDAAPHNILRGKGCPKCSNNIKKTHEEYVEEVKIKNSNVTVVDTYINATTKIAHRCNLCGNEWDATPDNILHGHWCKSCSLKEAFQIHPKTQPTLRKSHEQYIKELYNANPNIEIIDQYITTEHTNLFRCKICGYKWYGNPKNYLGGKGCLMCARRKDAERKTFTQEEFVEKLGLVNRDIEVLGKYINSKIKILCRCKIDNHEFYALPSSLLAGHGCPVCNTPKGEKIIKEFLDKNRINYSIQKKYDQLLGVNGGMLSYDFYLPQYNLLIEFQGLQHEQPVEYFGGEEQLKIQQEHDRRKREYAKLHNINLLEIWYYDIDNIESILLQKINNLKLESVETTGVA